MATCLRASGGRASPSSRTRPTSRPTSWRGSTTPWVRWRVRGATRSTPRYRSTTMISQSRRVTGRPLPASPAAPRAADYALYARLCLSRTQKNAYTLCGKVVAFFRVREMVVFHAARCRRPCRGCVRLRRRGALKLQSAIALSRALSPFFSPISGAPSELHWSEGYPCRLVGARVCVCGRAKK